MPTTAATRRSWWKNKRIWSNGLNKYMTFSYFIHSSKKKKDFFCIVLIKKRKEKKGRWITYTSSLKQNIHKRKYTSNNREIKKHKRITIIALFIEDSTRKTLKSFLFPFLNEDRNTRLTQMLMKENTFCEHNPTYIYCHTVCFLALSLSHTLAQTHA